MFGRSYTGTPIGGCSEWRQVTGLGAVDSSLLWGAEGLPPNDSGWSGLVLQGEELSGCLVESSASGFAIHLRVSLTEEEGDTFMRSLGVDRMEDCPVVETEGDMEVVDAEFECRD